MINLIIGVGILVIAVAIFSLGYWCGSPAEKVTKPLDRCDCSDVNQCDRWCSAKKNFSKYIDGEL